MSTDDMQQMIAGRRRRCTWRRRSLSYIVTITAATRRCPSCGSGVSPRGSLALAQAAQAYAATQGRPFVTPDDVKAMAPVGARRTG